MKDNCIVAQSGGPTVAINASLAGVIDGVKRVRNLQEYMVRFTEYRESLKIIS